MRYPNSWDLALNSAILWALHAPVLAGIVTSIAVAIFILDGAHVLHERRLERKMRRLLETIERNKHAEALRRVEDQRDAVGIYAEAGARLGKRGDA